MFLIFFFLEFTSLYEQYAKDDIYSREVIQFMRLLDQDPDSYFTGHYDWYNTGGVIDILKTRSDDECLIHVTGKYLDEIQINDSSMNKLYNKVITRKNRIYEVIKGTEKCNINTKFAVRQKNSIKIYSFDPDSETIVQKLCGMSSTVPYVTGSFHRKEKNTFVTVDAEKDLQIWDIEEKKLKCTSVLETHNNLTDNWSCIRNFNRNTFVHTDRCHLNIIDIRGRPVETMIESKFCMKNTFEICDQISSLCCSGFGNLIYLGTDHHLIGVDIRKIGGNFNIDPVIKQTHNLKGTPNILKSVIYNENIEFLLIASQLVGDNRICTNMINGTSYYSDYLPYTPKSVLNSLEFSQMNGKCIDPKMDYKNHFNHTNVGMIMYKSKDGFYVLTENSLGDVFKQKLVKEIDHRESEIPIIFERETLKLLSAKERKIQITDLNDMKSIIEIIKKEPVIEREVLNVDNENEEEEKKKSLKWQRSVKELGKCQDFLAADILSVWEMNINPDDITNENTEENIEKQDQRVAEWLNQYDGPMVSIFPDEPIKNEITIDEMTDGDFLDRSTEMTDARPRNSKKKSKRNTNYVQGF